VSASPTRAGTPPSPFHPAQLAATAGTAARPAAVVVLGRPGVEREAVEVLLRSASLDVVDLVRLEGAPAGSGAPAVVAVLVDPDGEVWRHAERLAARIVVVLDAPPSDDRTIQLLRDGADAVLHAGVEVERLLAAVRIVGIGQAYLGTGQARTVVDHLRAERRSVAAVPSLTRRESEILLSIERGESVRETAGALAISVKTVQNLQSRLFRKLGARNRPQAIARAYELGLVDGALP
jgi:DNA-binding NarL/FixJ family response regulator